MFSYIFHQFDLITICLFLITLSVIIYWLQISISARNLPPGPTGWPLLGVLPRLAFAKRNGLPTHELFAQLSARYGRVISMYMGRRLVVVLNSYDSIREAMHNPGLLNRPDSSILDDVIIARGVGTANGQSWKEQRRFTLNTFRSFGVGKSSFEEQILNEAEPLLEQVASTNGEPFDIGNDIGNAVSNLICATVFGKRYDYMDPNFKRLRDIIYKQFIMLGSGGLNLFLPIMRYMQPKKHKELKKNYREQYKFAQDIIDEHKAVYDPDNLNDYIDVYLREIEISKQVGRESFISDKTMVASVGNLFGAGVDTTANLLYWALLYMIGYPEIQKKIQAEMDRVVGRNRLPRFADKADMPYTTATLLELGRYVTLLPLGAPRSAADDVTLMGYKVPKGAVVLANIWSVHHDPSVWEDCEEFKPERFLDETGTKICRQDEMLAFSVGRRNCLGEGLAQMELFIFFTHLLHQFTFTKEDKSTQPNFKGVVGALLLAEPFKLRAIRRY